MNLPQQLGLLYMVSETALSLARRSGRGTKAADTGSLAALWLAIGVGIGAGLAATSLARSAGFPLPPPGRQAAAAVFFAGLALRWWAIVTLGRFFTVNVAIAADHRLVVRGPYRWMRHPSYTGMMLAFAAFAVTLQNWVSIISVLLPIGLALAYRIRVEEAALLGAFRDEYPDYAKKTKRLIPWLI